MTEHKIGWLNMPGYKPETWNPIVGCSKVSPGCDNCYAERMAKRLSVALGAKGKEPSDAWIAYSDVITNGKWNGTTHLVKSALDKPMKWKEPRMIFVCSMGDLFHETVPFEWIDQVFDIIYDCSEHIFIILTKRAERMKEYIDYRIKSDKFYGHSWVWLGVTAENQEQAEYRIPFLSRIEAAKRFVSIEPMLNQINLTDLRPKFEQDGSISANILTRKITHNFGNGKILDCNKLDWVICGGETGPKARPMHPDWVRSVRDQCKDAGTPFFFKQWGKYYTRWGNMTTWEDEFKMYTSYQQFTQKVWVKKGDVLVDMDGKHPKTGGDMQTAKYPVAIMNPTSVKCNKLDGRGHYEWPQLGTLNLKPETL